MGYDQQLLPGEFIIKKCLKFLPRNSRESWRDIVLKIFLPYVFCLSKRWLETSPNVIFTWCQIEGRGGLRRTTNYSVKRRLTYCLCGRLLHLAAITLIHSLRHLKKFTKFWSWIFLNLFHPKKKCFQMSLFCCQHAILQVQYNASEVFIPVLGQCADHIHRTQYWRDRLIKPFCKASY